MSYENCFIKLERPVLDSHVYQDYHPKQPDLQLIRNIRKKDVTNYFLSFLPFITELKHYKWKSDLINDLISGLTVGIMNIPQGLAYSVLALLPPVNGLYASFMGPLLYAFFGQCPNLSLGTSALGCLLISEAITDVESNLNDGNEYDPVIRVSIATSVTFMAGLFQILFGFIQLGTFSAVMAPSMVKAFNSATAVHVFTSQIKSIFGMSTLPVISGMHVVPKTFITMFQYYSIVNWRTLVISLVAISVLCLIKLLVGPAVKKRFCQFPIPIELILVVVFTVAFRFTDWSKEFKISTIGEISSGFPQARLPGFTYVPLVVQKSLVIAIVLTSINVSLIKRIQNDKEIRLNHEIFNHGIMNFFVSFFCCFTLSASLSRSLISQDSGGRTTLNGIFSALFMLSILLYFGPFFSSLPKCILASIVIVALKNLLLEITCLPALWKRYKVDFYVFLITYLVTVFIDITVGLLVGIAICLLVLMFNIQKVDFVEVTRHQDYLDIFIPYVEVDYLRDQKSNPATKVIQTMRDCLKIQSDFQIESFEKAKSQLMLDGNIRIYKLYGNLNFVSAPRFYDNFQIYILDQKEKFFDFLEKLKIIIFDLDGISKIDPYGVTKLGELRRKLANNNVNVIFSGDMYRYEFLMKDVDFEKKALEPLCLDDNTNNEMIKDPYIFATLLDALHYSVLSIERMNRTVEEESPAVDNGDLTDF